jgi:hypothetical protein
MNVTYWIDETTPTSTLVETLMQDADCQHLRKFNLYLEYRAQLQSYTKMFFDPFRRYDRITFVLETQPSMVSVESTVGQLNFFRWALDNNVIDYIVNHLSDIEDCMASFQKTSKTNTVDNTNSTNGTKEQKSKHCSGAALQANTVTHTHCFIRFD